MKLHICIKNKQTWQTRNQWVSVHCMTYCHFLFETCIFWKSRGFLFITTSWNKAVLQYITVLCWTVILVSVADDASSGIQYLLKLVGDGLGCPSKNSAAVVHARRHKGVNLRSHWIGFEWTSNSSELTKPVKRCLSILRSNNSVTPRMRTWSLAMTVSVPSHKDGPELPNRAWYLIHVQLETVGRHPVADVLDAVFKSQNGRHRFVVTTV